MKSDAPANETVSSALRIGAGKYGVGKYGVGEIWGRVLPFAIARVTSFMTVISSNDITVTLKFTAGTAGSQ